MKNNLAEIYNEFYFRITKNKEQFNELHSVVSNKVIAKLKILKENSVKTKKYEFFSYLQHAVIYFPSILQRYNYNF